MVFVAGGAGRIRGWIRQRNNRRECEKTSGFEMWCLKTGGLFIYMYSCSRIEKRKALNDSGSGLSESGGEGGIRTLETLLGPTRFPIVRARPNYATSPCLLYVS